MEPYKDAGRFVEWGADDDPKGVVRPPARAGDARAGSVAMAHVLASATGCLLNSSRSAEPDVATDLYRK